jgi:hypothetical protein
MRASGINRSVQAREKPSATKPFVDVHAREKLINELEIQTSVLKKGSPCKRAAWWQR